MNYKEATDHSMTVEWQTSKCPSQDCWCAMIEPRVNIQDDDGNDIYIVGAGSISKEYADHIVMIHNEWIKSRKNSDQLTNN